MPHKLTSLHNIQVVSIQVVAHQYIVSHYVMETIHPVIDVDRFSIIIYLSIVSANYCLIELLYEYMNSPVDGGWVFF